MKSSSSRLTALTKELSVQWQQVRELWNDERSREFETKYLQELFSSVDRTVSIIEEMDKLVSKIKKDCE